MIETEKEFQGKKGSMTYLLKI